MASALPHWVRIKQIIANLENWGVFFFELTSSYYAEQRRSCEQSQNVHAKS